MYAALENRETATEALGDVEAASKSHLSACSMCLSPWSLDRPSASIERTEVDDRELTRSFITGNFILAASGVRE